MNGGYRKENCAKSRFDWRQFLLIRGGGWRGGDSPREYQSTTKTTASLRFQGGDFLFFFDILLQSDDEKKPGQASI